MINRNSVQLLTINLNKWFYLTILSSNVLILGVWKFKNKKMCNFSKKVVVHI